MYQPNYTLNHRILNVLIKFELEKYKLDQINIPTILANKLSVENRTMSFYHIGHLLGEDIAFKKAEKISLGFEKDAIDNVSKSLINYKLIQDRLKNSIKSDYAIFDLSLFNEINTLASLNIYVNPTFRDQFEKVSDVWGEFQNASLNPKEELEELINYYKQTLGKIHNLILIANLIYRLIRIQPYKQQNTITIIAIIDYLLLTTTVLNPDLISVSSNIDRFENEYIECFNDSVKIEDNESLWIEKFIKNITDDLIQLREKVEEETQIKEKKNQPFLDLNQRQLKVLRYLQNIPTIKRDEYCKIMNVSTMTAFRDLNDLVEKKMLRLGGKGRGTKYLLYNR